MFATKSATHHGGKHGDLPHFGCDFFMGFDGSNQSFFELVGKVLEGLDWLELLSESKCSSCLVCLRSFRPFLTESSQSAEKIHSTLRAQEAHTFSQII